MNRASMLKSRIPDTHYCPRVRRWNTRHGERERRWQAEKETDMERQCVCERDIYILWS